MAGDVTLFFAVLVIFTLGFALAFAVLLPGQMNQPWYVLPPSTAEPAAGALSLPYPPLSHHRRSSLCPK
eukprot:108060-Prymnesium_polylepis.1